MHMGESGFQKRHRVVISTGVNEPHGNEGNQLRVYPPEGIYHRPNLTANVQGVELMPAAETVPCEKHDHLDASPLFKRKDN